MGISDALLTKFLDKLGGISDIAIDTYNSSQVALSTKNDRIYAVKVEGSVANKESLDRGKIEIFGQEQQKVKMDVSRSDKPDIPNIIWADIWKENRNGGGYRTAAWALNDVQKVTQVGQILDKSACRFENLGDMSTRDIKFSDKDYGEYDVHNQIEFKNNRVIMNEGGSFKEKID